MAQSSVIEGEEQQRVIEAKHYEEGVVCWPGIAAAALSRLSGIGCMDRGWLRCNEGGASWEAIVRWLMAGE